jgi:hypothetical protein
MLAALMILALEFGPVVSPAAPPALLSGAEAEEFLRTAEIVDRERVPVGVTEPHRVTLEDSSRTARAIWKTISEFSPKKEFHDGLPPEIGFRDSYKSEVAAYELDKLLGFGFVPPTVMRRVRRTKGSIQLWIEDCMTEGDRRQQGLKPPDASEWAKQMYDARLFHQLIHDSDYRNASNLLVDKNFRLWVVDHSRAFRTQARLLNQDYLRRFSRQHLERLRQLTPELLEDKLGEWLTSRQRKGLLARRDLILQLAEQLIAERGEEAVLF